MMQGTAVVLPHETFRKNFVVWNTISVLLTSLWFIKLNNYVQTIELYYPPFNS